MYQNILSLCFPTWKDLQIIVGCCEPSFQKTSTPFGTDIKYIFRHVMSWPAYLKADGQMVSDAKNLKT